jgi:fibronectin type 3 domain-containing protein
MMRPMVFNVARLLPAAPILSYTRVGAPVNLTWTDATPPTPVNLGNPANEIGFRIQRATVGKNAQPGAYAQIGSALANATRYTDTTADTVSTYSYEVVAFNAAGNSTSAPVTVGPPTGLPAAPTGLLATLQSGPQVGLTWTDNATNETGFVVERAVGAGAFSTLATVGPRINTGSVSYADTTVTAGNTYAYRVKAVNGGGSSAYSNTASVSLSSPPAAPSGLTARAARTKGLTDTVTLAWRDNANNETGFTIQRATNNTFTAGLNTSTVAANTITTQQTGLARGTIYWYRIRAVNLSGASAWSNVVIVITP